MSLLDLGLAARAELEAYADADFPRGNWQLIETGGAAMDATGLDLYFSVRAYDDQAGSALIDINSTASSGDRIAWVTRTEGRFEIVIDKATIAALPRNGAATNMPTAFRWSLDGKIGTDEARLAFGILYVWGVI